jgi:threonine synthase
MKIPFYSTNCEVEDVDLADALLQGQAGDKGLFLPRQIPPLTKELLTAARELSYPELAAAMLTPYAEGVFTPEVITAICDDAYDYDVPLEQIAPRRHVMRLDQGPTASFKDFAARFMGRALSRLVRERGTDLLILTATSGDTGSAVAQAFHGVDAIRVLVLFPSRASSTTARRWSSAPSPTRSSSSSTCRRPTRSTSAGCCPSRSTTSTRPRGWPTPPVVSRCCSLFPRAISAT